MTVVVTGAGGAVGSEVARLVIEGGHEVVGIDNDLRRRYTGEAWSVAPVIDELRAATTYRHWDLDLRRADAFDEALSSTPGVDLVVHAAAQTSATWAWREPVADFQTNAMASLHLLEAVRRHAPDALVVWISTTEVYAGRDGALPLRDEATRCDLPRNHRLWSGFGEDLLDGARRMGPHAASRLAGETAFREHAARSGVDAVVLRVGGIVASTPCGSLAERVTEAVLREEQVVVPGVDGREVTDLLHARDVARAVLAVAREERPAEVYNVSGGRPASASLIEIAEWVGELVGKEPRLSFGGSDGSVAPWCIASPARMREDFPSWRPLLDVEDLVEELIALVGTRA